MKKDLIAVVGSLAIWFVLGSTVFVASGCPLLGSVEQPIEAGNVAPLWTKVLNTYDTYVTNDTTLTNLERTDLELDSTLLKAILEKALGDGGE